MSVNDSHESADMERDSQETVSPETLQPEMKHGEGKHAPTRHARARSRRWLRIVLVVVGVILVLAIIAAAALGNFVNSGKDELLADNNTSTLRKSMRHDNVNYVFNEDMVTVALIGTDRGTGSAVVDSNGSADAIILVAYNTKTSEIKLINVPRNVITAFDFSYPDGAPGSATTFISAAYAFGHSDAEGAENVCGALSDLFRGLPVENYVAMLESCIGPLTEAMGGVTLTAIDDVAYMGIYKGETYTLKGEQALRYVQFRDTSKMSSPTDRIERQKDFIKAFLPQTIAAVKKDPSILGKLYDIITDPQYMTTNLHANELAYLASSVILNGVSDLEMVTVECDQDYDAGLLAYFPKEDELVQLLLDTYYEPVDHF